jgi:hypothetical protein
MIMKVTFSMFCSISCLQCYVLTQQPLQYSKHQMLNVELLLSSFEWNNT